MVQPQSGRDQHDKPKWWRSKQQKLRVQHQGKSDKFMVWRLLILNRLRWSFVTFVCSRGLRNPDTSTETFQKNHLSHAQYSWWSVGIQITKKNVIFHEASMGHWSFYGGFPMVRAARAECGVWSQYPKWRVQRNGKYQVWSRVWSAMQSVGHRANNVKSEECEV